MFVRAASAHAEAGEFDLQNGQLTPQLIELIKRTFRGVHLLAYLKREELGGIDKDQNFKKAAEAAQIAQAETLGTEESDRAS